MTTIVLPDAESVTLAWLKAHSAVTSLIPAASIAQQVNGTTWPRLTVVRVGGTAPVWQRLDHATLDVSAWSDNSVAASLLLRTALAALHEMSGYIASGAVVTGVSDVLGPRYLPDTSRTPTIPRYLASVAVSLRPNP